MSSPCRRKSGVSHRVAGETYGYNVFCKQAHGLTNGQLRKGLLFVGFEPHASLSLFTIHLYFSFFALLLTDLAFSSEDFVNAAGLVAPNDLFDLPALHAVCSGGLSSSTLYVPECKQQEHLSYIWALSTYFCKTMKKKLTCWPIRSLNNSGK